ncbi:hypothetical protein V494_01902 [Pseudogymnoascus sp. VKM F-4513 (FW-928)]|nr:hypothetical protein V494_01902 [Pseudogymnoascus sp. VKM F-4513 (FW-928)]
MASKLPPPNPENGEQSAVGDAPPAYNEATGTLDLNRGGLSTQSNFAGDGRIDIQIDEIDTELAQQIQQINSAAHQETQDHPLPAYDAPSYLAGSPGAAPLPLNVVIQVVGSRGDVQPFVALGRELKGKYGHRIRLATHGTFKKFVEENGLEFFEIGGDPTELMAFMVKNPGLIPGMKSLKEGEVGKRRRGIAQILEGCWKSCADAKEATEESSIEAKGGAKVAPFIAHAIIANPPSFAHIHCAQKLRIPLHIMFTMPWSATLDFPHPLANIKSTNASGSMTNEMSYTLVDMMTWQGLGDIINNFRRETLELPSPALIPKPKDWGPHISISGFYFLSSPSDYQPDAELADFLAAGPPPVYIGFGSIVVDDPNAMTKLIFDAVRKTGQRALVSKGWGGLGGDELDKPEGVFMIGNCPHDWLFKHVSCVVHHGGAGTMSAGIALGRPTVIVPFFGDQPFWGAMVARAGAGPLPVPYKSLTADGLANSILEALKPETLERARELGELIREEDGCKSGAESFHAHLNMDKLRCMMDPQRPAVWRVKTTGPKSEHVRLSTFAATVLGNEGIIDMNLMKLYQPCKYKVEEQFVLSNMEGPNPGLSMAGSVAHSLVHLPLNIGKIYAGVVTKPYKGAKTGGWRGFRKGLGKGLGNFLFPLRGVVIGGTTYGIRGAYEAIRRKMGSDTLSFILAAHFVQGYEEARTATEEQRLEVLRRWNELAPELREMKSTESSKGKNKGKGKGKQGDGTGSLPHFEHLSRLSSNHRSLEFETVRTHKQIYKTPHDIQPTRESRATANIASSVAPPLFATNSTSTTEYAMNQITSDEESHESSVGMPGSPPDLSLSSSKSSKSSFHSSYQSDDNGILADVGHFEDIGLDDAQSEQESADFVDDLPSHSSDRSVKGRSRSLASIQRNLTSKGRPGLPGAGPHGRKPTGEGLGLGLVPGSAAPRRTFSSQSMTSLGAMNGRNRSPSPLTQPGAFPRSPRSPRMSWQSNRERKSAQELEKECDDEDDDIPDECYLQNVPMSPRPPGERTVEATPTIPKEKVKPAGNGTPATPGAQGSLKQPEGFPKPSSPGFYTKPGRAKSWTVALSELNAEAKSLTEALEAHADEQLESNQPKRPPYLGDIKRSKSVMSELPLRRNDVMIDPLPISKEKMAVLSRTRPSWLPPKDPLEEKRHLKEYQKMMAASLEAEKKREASNSSDTSRDDTANSLLRIWEDHVLPNWEAATSLKRTRELWWRGIAPRSRGAVWDRAIGNELGVSESSYNAALKRAKNLKKKLAKGNATADDLVQGKWFESINRDVATTYPELRIFCPGGPLSESLVDVLMAYVMYRSDVGYVDGLSTATALLLLNFPTPAAAFCALANLLNRPLPLSFHTHDHGAMSRIHTLVLETLSAKFPRLYAHLCSTIQIDQQPGPCLNATFSSLLTKQLNLDVITRLWDIWVFEGDAVLVRAMVALIGSLETKFYGATSAREVLAILNDSTVEGEEDFILALRDAGR